VRHKNYGQEKPHRQIDEVRSGGGYYSQNDLRVHFGLGEVQKWTCLKSAGQRPNRFLQRSKTQSAYYITEGQGISRTVDFTKSNADCGQASKNLSS